MHSSQHLRSALTELHRKSYPAYKSLQGLYDFHTYLLGIDHVQGDPFAAPSNIHIEISGKKAGFPEYLYDTEKKRITLQDYLTRQLYTQIGRINYKAQGSGKSGLISISKCSQEVLERSCCQMDPQNGSLYIRIEIGFPANGRSINAYELIKILYDILPVCITNSLYYRNLDANKLNEAAALCEDQEAARSLLGQFNLAAFVANGAILPRESGISAMPMKKARPFLSPASMEVTLNLPNRGPVKGMGIKSGVTLIVGGGFHGKSTLLRALEMGVYNHIGGDGRELVITDNSALKLRAEDSRYISNVDISLFINHLPGKEDTSAFSTLNASGSTSQAANVIEGLEAGTTLFLIDEDTSATNFMIRDELMQSVVSDQEEPITPFIRRVRALYEKSGISSIIVAGSSGSFFHEADSILQMKEYIPIDITTKAKERAAAFTPSANRELTYRMPQNKRCPKATPSLTHNERVKIKVTGKDVIQLNQTLVDLRYLEQLTDPEQLWTLAYLLEYAAKKIMKKELTLSQVVDKLEELLDEKGLPILSPVHYLPANLCRPRRQEIHACFNRCRDLMFS